jgi:cytidylate kinase
LRFRTLTISRQYGSGGARIASLVAARLGWRLLDSKILDAVAQATRINPSVIQTHDERVTSWFHRLNRDALRSAALMAFLPCRDEEFFDADCMVSFTRKVIEEAHSDGGCVVVGRGAQCILDGCADVFRVFVYAPVAQRLHSVRLRTKEDIKEEQLNEVDAERARYIHAYFGRHWQDLDLYDLMISSKHGDEITASTILRAMGSERATSGEAVP